MAFQQARYSVPVHALLVSVIRYFQAVRRYRHFKLLVLTTVGYPQLACHGCNRIVLRLRAFLQLVACDRVVALAYDCLASGYRNTCKSLFSDEAAFRYAVSAIRQGCSVIRLRFAVCRDLYRYRLDAQLTVLSPRYDILFSFINGSDCSFSKYCRILASVCSFCTHLDSREICSLRCSGKSAYALRLPIIDLRIAVCRQFYVLIIIECECFILRIYYHFLVDRIYRRISPNCNWAFRYCFVIRLIRNNLILCCFFCCAVPVIMNRILIIVPDLPDCIKHIRCFIRMNDHIRTCCIFYSCCLRVCAPSDKLITGTGKDCTFCFYLLVILKSGYHYFSFTITGCSTVSVIGQ